MPAVSVVLAGPTAVGKGTVAADVRERPPRGLDLGVGDHPGARARARSTACTTGSSPTRSSTGWSPTDELLEWAVVHKAGPLRHAARGRSRRRWPPGRPALLEIDLQGARQVRETMPEALFVFLKPPSWDELVRRLVGRGTETEAERERRLETAREELAAEAEFDVTIVNHEVHDAADELVALMMLDQEPSRPDRP